MVGGVGNVSSIVPFNCAERLYGVWRYLVHTMNGSHPLLGFKGCRCDKVESSVSDINVESIA